MYTLRNSYLSVSVLDPETDSSLFGSRYCTGGYIWQIKDRKSKDLLSGPQYPSPNPPQFDGQGMPEAFVTAPESQDIPLGEDVLVIGVGLVRKDSDVTPFHSRNNPNVTHFCRWETAPAEDTLVMSTSHDYRDRRINVSKKIALERTTVHSTTLIENHSDTDLPIRWFAHPFFPLNSDLSCGKVLGDFSIPPNDGYFSAGDGIYMRKEYPWNKGLYIKFSTIEQSVDFNVNHPIAGKIEMECQYPIDTLALWANANTFSFEPFLDTIIPPGKQQSWGISYRFKFDSGFIE